MALPEIVVVKISTEAAGSITLTPVVAREMTLLELAGEIVSVTAKDAPRLDAILRRGSFVSGGSRFRWAPLAPETEDLKALLAAFPDPEPERPFERQRCIRAVICGDGWRAPIDRGAGERRRIWKRRSFWDELMSAAAGGTLEYAGYSYRERADVYKMPVPAALSAHLRDCAGLLPFDSLAARIRSGAILRLEFSVAR
mgnify:CR=1 FL=1